MGRGRGRLKINGQVDTLTVNIIRMVQLRVLRIVFRRLLHSVRSHRHQILSVHGHRAGLLERRTVVNCRNKITPSFVELNKILQHCHLMWSRGALVSLIKKQSNCYISNNNID